MFLIGCSYFLLLPIALFCSRKNLLYKCKGIMFPSMTVPTWYGTIIETWFDDVFRFSVITDHLLLKIIEFIFAMSIWSSSSWCWSGSCSRSWNSSISPMSADLSKVPICQALSGWMAGATITATLLHGNFGICFAVFPDCLSVPLSLS